METSCQLHALATSILGKEPLVPIRQEVGWAPEPSWLLRITCTFIIPTNGQITCSVTEINHSYSSVCPPNFSWTYASNNWKHST